VTASPTGNNIGVYTADRIRLNERLSAEFGLRWDRQSYTDDSQWSPRLNVAYDFGRSTIRAAWGLYHQPQRLIELQVEDGVDHFFPAQQAEHRIITFESDLPAIFHFRVDAYQKKLSDIRPRFENLFTVIELFPEVLPDRVRIKPDRGESRGVEFTLRRSVENWQWWITYSRSSVFDVEQGVSTPRSWDQPNAFMADVNYRLNDRWNLNAAWVYHTGWPTTDLTGSVLPQPDGSSIILPVVGKRNAIRHPAFHRMDLRISRFVPLRHGSFLAFFEITNLYNRQNVCCTSDFDYSENPDGSVQVDRQLDYWLPWIPSFGLNWQF